MTEAATLTRHFQDGYKRLAAAIEEHHAATETVLEAQRKYDEATAHARTVGFENDDGERQAWADLGRNDTERSAVFTLRLPVHYPAECQALEEARAELSTAKLELDLARLNWDACRYHLRLLEYEARLSPDGVTAPR